VSGPTYDEQDEIERAHMAGDHYGAPEGDCWLCELDDDRPEAPDPE
jgi:hypothetical protein